MQINDYKQEIGNLKANCEKLRRDRKKAEKERDEALKRVGQLEKDLVSLRGSVYDMLSVFED